MNIQNRPLLKKEKDNIPELELRVINEYERITKRKFMRFDLITLKGLIEVATPEQIISQIKRFHYHEKYSANFKTFDYIERPVKSQFKNRRGGKKHE